MKETKSEKILLSINAVILFIASLVCVLPVINVFAVSFSEVSAVESGHVSFWPVGFTFDTVKMLVKGTSAMRSALNSAIITVVGTIFSMVLTIFTAYPLSKSYFVGHKFFTKAIVFTMLFNGGIIPTYIVVQKLGLINSYWAIWFTIGVSTYNMLVMRAFFYNIPKELEEAAIIDGCGEYRVMFLIYLPLSKPVMATLVLFYSVSYWNVFMQALLYIQDSKKQALSVVVQDMIRSLDIITQEITTNPEEISAITPVGLKAAGVVLMLLPMLAIYPFIQKYFIKGVMLGAVKG